MPNRYLEILELKPGATKGEIKSAYRRLSKRYHPDINKDEDAKERFIEINEAYNFLMKVGPAPHNEQVRYDYNPQQSEYDRWRAEARERARKRAAEEIRLQAELIKKILRGFEVITYFVLLLNALIVLDFILPRTEYQAQSVSGKMIYEKSKSTKFYSYDRIFNDDLSIRVERGSVKKLKSVQWASLYLTRIYQKPRYVVLGVADGTIKINTIYGLFDLYLYMVPVVLLLIYLYYRAIRVLDTKLTVALFIVVMTLLQYYFFAIV